MEILKETVKEIAGFLIVVSILENLIQDINFRKYLKMAAGMVLILIIIQPFVKWTGRQKDYSDMFTLREYQEDIYQMERSLGKINQAASKDIMNQYKVYMEEKISGDLENAGFEIREVSIDLFMNQEEKIELAKVVIRWNRWKYGEEITAGNYVDSMKAKNNYLKKYVANLYTIDESLIEII